MTNEIIKLLDLIEEATAKSDSHKLTKFGEMLDIEITGVKQDGDVGNRLVEVFSSKGIYGFDDGCMQLMMTIVDNLELFPETFSTQFFNLLESHLLDFKHFGPLFYASEVVFLNFSEKNIIKYLATINFCAHPMYLAALPNAIRVAENKLQSRTVTDSCRLVLNRLSKHSNKDVAVNATDVLRRIK